MTHTVSTPIRTSALIAGALFLLAGGCAGDGPETMSGTGGSTGTTGGSSGSASTGGSTGSPSTGTGGSTAAPSSGGSTGSTATGGSTGAPATGGSTGMAGGLTGGPAGPANGPGCADMIAPADVIVDFEDGSPGISMAGMRSGGWYSFNDGTGMQQPPAMGTFKPVDGGACGSMYALRSTGTGFTMWGAGVGTDLAGSITGKKAYDASAYSGIRFMAKAAAPVIARFKVPDAQTSPEGGTCGMKCFDDFGENITLGAEWKAYTVKFADMKQEGWAMQMLTTIAKDKLYAIQFQVKQGVNFDIWIDNVAFVK